MLIDEQNYVNMLERFFPFAKQEIRHIDDLHAYYGTGEAGHWSIQSNFNVAGGMAILAEQTKDPALAAEARELALKLFRYNLHTHKTGSMKNTCGEQWGGSWIAVLGLERMAAGQLALESLLTEKELAEFRALRIHEADWLLAEYPVVAGIKVNNRPESNYWNASFLYKTAIDFPDCPNAAAYVEKACALFLNSISIPSDQTSGKIYRGKPVKDWFAGPNFTENYSLNHHAYMNVGYSVITLSHAAYLYFYAKSKGWELPEEAMHRVKDLWDVTKHFIFPDGRLLRIGGDTRARYCYCQIYLLPVLLMMQDLYGEKLSAELEYGMTELIAREQNDNSNGSFYGSRLDEMTWQSRYYYTRLESDPFASVAFAAAIRRQWNIFRDTGIHSTPAPVVWNDDFHGADMIRTETTVRSIVRCAGEGPVLLAHPLADSDLAEWHNNGHAQMSGHFIAPKHPEYSFHRSIPGGFINSGAVRFVEALPYGEGEGGYEILRSQAACAALPDGKTMIVLEHLTSLKEHSLTSLRTVGWLVPNDFFNGKKRTFKGENFSGEVTFKSGKGVIETNSKWINVDDRISLIAGYGFDTFKIHAPAECLSVLKYANAMKSLYINEICGSIELDPRIRRMPGDVLADTGYAVIAGSTADDAKQYALKEIARDGMFRAVAFTAPDGVSWRFAANFGTEAVEWDGETIPAGECCLKN